VKSEYTMFDAKTKIMSQIWDYAQCDFKTTIILILLVHKGYRFNRKRVSLYVFKIIVIFSGWIVKNGKLNFLPFKISYIMLSYIMLWSQYKNWHRTISAICTSPANFIIARAPDDFKHVFLAWSHIVRAPAGVCIW